jgi:hypothetical protein
MIPIKNLDICKSTEKYILQQCNCDTVPFMIGCGLAKGNWKKYLDLLNNFHYQLQQYGGGLVFYKI